MSDRKPDSPVRKSDTGEPGDSRGAPDPQIVELAKSIRRGGLEAIDRSLKKANADGLDAQMQAVLAEIAKNSKDERCRVRAAQVLYDGLARRLAAASAALPDGSDDDDDGEAGVVFDGLDEE